MSFSENMAKVVSDQLSRFVTLNRHQLAGHVSNLDFWIDQAQHALDVIDDYQERFRRLEAAQDDYVTEHQTESFFPTDPDIRGTPDPPRRIANASLREARRAVIEATYRFLVRCCNDGLIPVFRLRAVCKSLDIGVEAADLHRRHG